VPTGVVFPVPGHSNTRRALAELDQAFDCPNHVGLGPDDADQVLHELLEIVLHRVRALSSGPVEG